MTRGSRVRTSLHPNEVTTNLVDPLKYPFWQGEDGEIVGDHRGEDRSSEDNSAGPGEVFSSPSRQTRSNIVNLVNVCPFLEALMSKNS